jgi:hypothetical protein
MSRSWTPTRRRTVVLLLAQGAAVAKDSSSSLRAPDAASLLGTFAATSSYQGPEYYRSVRYTFAAMLDPLHPSFGERPRTPPSIHRGDPEWYTADSNRPGVDLQIRIMATGNPELVRASDRQEWVPSTHDLRVIIALAVIFLLVALSSTSTLTSLQVTPKLRWLCSLTFARLLPKI